MGIDTTDNTDTTTPQEGSSMSDSRDEAIEAGAYPIPPIPFSQMTVDGKLVHAITTNSHGITRLRKYSDSLADTIGEVRREYREWEERLKGMRIELTPEEEHPSAMLERLASLESHLPGYGKPGPTDAALEFLRKSLHEVTIDGEGRGNRILELAIRATALEEGINGNNQAPPMCDRIEALEVGHSRLIADKPGWDDLDERIETRTADFVTDDYLGEWMGDNGYVHESNFGDAITEHIDISEISSQVQENLDMDDLAYEVQNNFDMCSLAEEVRENLDLGDTVASAMAEHGCRVLKENPDFADDLCQLVLSYAETALDTRIDAALQEAVLDGLRRVCNVPAFQEATMLHLRMDELAESVASVKAMVKDLEHF